MPSRNDSSIRNVRPDKRKITKIQAKRLASLSGVKESELMDRSIIDLSDKLKWEINPELFLFRKICGKVVKKDAVTGVDYPVPFATVYVEDTDCNLISYFPMGWSWSWHFPFFCNREVIATTKTDECGNFCVWIPRFDIDWILKWRKARICFPYIFRRPEIRDFIPRIPEREIVDGPWPPIPDPRPEWDVLDGPWSPIPNPRPTRKLEVFSPSIIEALAGSSAMKISKEIAPLYSAKEFGSPTSLMEGSLQTRAFESEMPPPLPAEFHKVISKHDVVAAEKASVEEGIRSAIPLKVGIDPSAKEFSKFSTKSFIGPFFRP